MLVSLLVAMLVEMLVGKCVPSRGARTGRSLAILPIRTTNKGQRCTSMADSPRDARTPNTAAARCHSTDVYIAWQSRLRARFARSTRRRTAGASDFVGRAKPADHLLVKRLCRAVNGALRTATEACHL